MSVSEAFEGAVPGRMPARRVWELRQQVRALEAEREELVEELAELRSQLIGAYQRLAAGAAGPDVPNRLLRLVCDEANRIRLEALRYAQKVEYEARSQSWRAGPVSEG
ncbi:hypothetical protein ACFFS4_02675 [Kutzneria kofuensis]|uniref:Enoyl-CoA hydratase/carnithine racemase n=1 Tax=Kutzneria kofuensis TaxID=103725 RepID=A0A7W9NLP6_9PSEU|nr:hypothetical protein [Kutzneria kofuensis]MBB5897260.1 enoyl-CoA hydratase/carnithine racemase [Kutzneria kofuensis]